MRCILSEATPVSVTKSSGLGADWITHLLPEKGLTQSAASEDPGQLLKSAPQPRLLQPLPQKQTLLLDSSQSLHMQAEHDALLAAVLLCQFRRKI